MKRFVGSYWWEGHRVQFEVMAFSKEDAERRLRYCRPSTGATIDGELIADIPVNPVTLAPVGIVARFWCWVRNLGRQGMARGKVWRNTMRAQRQKDVADSQRALDELVARGLAVKGPDDRYRTPEAHEAVFGKPN